MKRDMVDYTTVGRNVPRKPRLVGGVKGHNMNVISFARISLAASRPGSPALCGELHITTLIITVRGKRVILDADLFKWKSESVTICDPLEYHLEVHIWNL